MDTNRPDLIVAGRRIGGESTCFIIAEAGVNHNGSLDLAMQLIDVAARARADAVKFQTFIPEHVVSDIAPKADYQLQVTDQGESQLEMERRLALPFDDFRTLKAHADSLGVMFLSSPFDVASVEFLAELGLPALKIPSGELTHWALLRAAAKTGLPLLLSTGMGSLQEVRRAVEQIAEYGNPALGLFHCTSSYPAPEKDCNLHAMATMRAEFGCVVGYSDHTPGLVAPTAAVALGAAMIEKHFTLDKAMEGPDHQASLDPEELASLVQAIRATESSLGDGIKAPKASEQNTAEVARRSLFAAKDLEPGQVVGDDDVIALRPSGGIPADALDEVLGRKVIQPIASGTMVAKGDLA